MKKISKKIIAIILCITVVAVAFVGCSKSGDTKQDTTKSNVQAVEGSYKFGIIVQSGANGAFVDMKDGIIDQLNAKGYVTDKNTEFVYKDAQGDTTALSTIATSMDDGSYNAVFTIGTACTQAFVNLQSKTPCFFCAVSAPVVAGVISDMAKPDKNATGTSNAIPASDIIDMGYKITPDVKKWGLIYDDSQQNSTDTVKSVSEYLKSKSIPYETVTVANSSEVQSQTQTLVSKGCDVLFVPNDSTVQDGVKSLGQVCSDNGIPAYASSATTVQSGCLGTLAIDDKGIGTKTADMCIEYLNGKAIADIPSIVVGVDYCTFNTGVASSLGLQTPTKDTIGYDVKTVTTK